MYTELVFQGVYRACISGGIQSLYFRVNTDLLFQGVSRACISGIKWENFFLINAILYLIERFLTAIFFDTSESFFLKILKVNSDFICEKGE